MNPFHYRAKTNTQDVEAIAYKTLNNVGGHTVAIPQWAILAVSQGRIVNTPAGDDLLTMDGKKIPLNDSMIVIKLNDGELTAVTASMFETLYTKST
jgi:hypothetical protein